MTDPNAQNSFPSFTIRDRLANAQNAEIGVVTYSPKKDSRRMGPFRVSSMKPLEADELRLIVETISSPMSYHQHFVTRHRATPNVVIKINNSSGPLITLFDLQGGKLGFLIDNVEMVRDYVRETPNIVALERLVNGYIKDQEPDQ